MRRHERCLGSLRPTHICLPARPPERAPDDAVVILLAHAALIPSIPPLISRLGAQIVLLQRNWLKAVNDSEFEASTRASRPVKAASVSTRIRYFSRQLLRRGARVCSSIGSLAVSLRLCPEHRQQPRASRPKRPPGSPPGRLRRRPGPGSALG